MQTACNVAVRGPCDFAVFCNRLFISFPIIYAMYHAARGHGDRERDHGRNYVHSFICLSGGK
jgi:hypothetical protein